MIMVVQSYGHSSPVGICCRFRLISSEPAYFRDAEMRSYRRSVAEGRRLSLLDCEQGQYKCRVGNMIPVAIRMGVERRRRTRPLNSAAGSRCHGCRVCPVIRPTADQGGEGCASALAGAAVLSQQRRGWELALLPGTVLCRTVRTALDLIAHSGSTPIAQTLFHCSAAPCWQPRRVDAGMQKGTKRPICPPIRGVSSLLVPCSFTAYSISVPCRFP